MASYKLRLLADSSYRNHVSSHIEAKLSGPRMLFYAARANATTLFVGLITTGRGLRFDELINVQMPRDLIAQLAISCARLKR